MFDPDSGFWRDMYEFIKGWFRPRGEAPGQWINLNGGRIEKKYFMDSLKEAREAKWEPNTDSIEGISSIHDHCTLCEKCVSLKGGELRFVAVGHPIRWPYMGMFLCTYCHEHFIVNGKDPCIEN